MEKVETLPNENIEGLEIEGKVSPDLDFSIKENSEPNKESSKYWVDDKGVLNIGKIREVKSGESGIFESTTGDVGEVKSEWSGILRSTTGDVGEVKSEWNGILRSTTGNVGEVKSKGNGILGSTTGNVGEVKSERGGILGSTTGNVGEVKSERGGIFESTTGDVREIYTEHGSGIVNSRIRLLHKNADVDKSLFSNSHFNRVSANSISAETLDKDSYRNLVAADEIDVENYNDLPNVITPQKESSEKHGFIQYTGKDWEQAKEFLKDVENTKALNMFDLKKKGVEKIESLDQLKELNKELEGKLEGLSYEDINKEYDANISGFNEINDQYFVQALKAKKETFRKHGKENIGKFGAVYSQLSKEHKKKLISNLETGKEENYKNALEEDKKKGSNRTKKKLEEKGQKHKPGKDLINAGKESLSGYGGFIKDPKQTLEEILDDKKENISPSKELERAPEYGDLKKLYNEYQEEIGETAALSERAEVKKLKFEAENKVKGLEYQRKNLGESLQKKEDSEYSIENDFKQREKISRTLKPKDYNQLEGMLTEDLENKKRDYTIKAITKAGKNKTRELYQNATGQDENPDNLSENHLEALKIYQRRKNRESEKLLQNENGSYQLPANLEWLKEKGFNLENITNFEYEVSNIDDGDAKQNIENKKAELKKEMYDLLGRFNELTGNNYQAQSIEEFEKLKENISVPKDEEAASIYMELAKEKPNEYKSLEGSLKGDVPESLKIKPASPMDTVQMGNYFTGSCLGIGGANDWSAPSYAIDVNKPVLFAYDQQGQVVGRVSTGITEDGQLIPLSRAYDNTQANLKPALKEAAEAYANHLGLEFNIKKSENIKTLESQRFYSEQFE